MHSRDASRISTKLDVSGGVAGRADSSAFAGISIINRNSVSVRVHYRNAGSRNAALNSSPVPRPDNLPSRRVAEKREMKIKKETVFRGFPTLVFAISREQWLAEDGAG